MKQHTVPLVAALIMAVAGLVGTYITVTHGHSSSDGRAPGSPVVASIPTAAPTPAQGSSQPPTPPSLPATPVGGGDGAGSWIAQLYSEPVSSGIATRDQRLAQVRADVPTAQVLRSDDFASLRQGYWVIYASGPFTDGSAALAFCAAHGRAGKDQCIGRFLSHDAADFPYQCDPPTPNTSRYCKHS
ncbi:hypothetical protein ACFW1A_36085 [Kitasatospora sp. NPDC058965]|uniref:hypothetical protein n=1 Tax=Kitasatospora sp. NPDC058965 TaxID=3346682 RepID=UPI00367AA9C8